MIKQNNSKSLIDIYLKICRLFPSKKNLKLQVHSMSKKIRKISRISLNINYNKTEYIFNDPDELYTDGNLIKNVGNSFLFRINNRIRTSNMDIRWRSCTSQKINLILESRDLIKRKL